MKKWLKMLAMVLSISLLIQIPVYAVESSVSQESQEEPTLSSEPEDPVEEIEPAPPAEEA